MPGLYSSIFVESVFEIKLKFLWPKVHGAGGLKKSCEPSCMGSTAESPVNLGYFNIYLYNPYSLFSKNKIKIKNYRLQTSSGDYYPWQQHQHKMFQILLSYITKFDQINLICVIFFFLKNYTWFCWIKIFC